MTWCLAKEKERKREGSRENEKKREGARREDVMEPQRCEALGQKEDQQEGGNRQE